MIQRKSVAYRLRLTSAGELVVTRSGGMTATAGK